MAFLFRLAVGVLVLALAIAAIARIFAGAFGARPTPREDAREGEP